MNAELQRAHDMLAAMQTQRDQALNALVIVQAELTAARREITATTASQTPSEAGVHVNASY